MITNTEAILYHYDEDSGTETVKSFTRAAISGISSERETGGLRRNTCNFSLRIPTKDSICVACGDKIYVKRLNDVFTVVGFSDNRRGSRGVQHWRFKLM